MTTTELLKTIAHDRELAVGLVYDPDAEPSECWVASIGLSALGAGGYPSSALGHALLDLDGECAVPSPRPGPAVIARLVDGRWERSA
jgi:hypothetical protein